MKRQELTDIVNKQLHRIEKFSERLPGLFSAEDIHDLRVSYKKLRAFLRLLQLEKDAGDLHMPDSLKAVYQSCGGVRDKQLFLQQIHNRQLVSELPCFVLRCRQKLFACKEEAVRAVEQMHFKKAVDAIKKQLPNRLHNGTVHHFLQQKMAAIHILLLVTDNDHNLHSIRKNVKDMMYNTRLIEQEAGKAFPATAMVDENQLNDMAGQLGDYNDLCLAVALLQSGLDSDCDGQEQVLVSNWRQQLLLQKENKKQQLQQQVQLLRKEYAY